MAAVASCCVNWLVPLRPAGAIAFTFPLVLSLRRGGGVAAVGSFQGIHIITFATILKASRFRLED